ncbi:MAG: hypothetical protein ACE5G0_19380 [Rhodothermales bacterium]
MGQQQLLLLVLGIVIVGLAVVVGINAFSENRTKSNADALVTDALRVASDIQAWALKPGQFGGMLATQTIADVTFDAIGYPNSSSTYSNVNGDFTLAASASTNCPAITIPSGNSALIHVNATNTDTNNEICVAIAGTTSDDIGTGVFYGN